MADWIDNSSEVQQLVRDEVVKKHINRPQVKSTGICTDCCEPIAEKRLEINPYAARCIDCQTDYELKQKQRGI